LQIASHSTGYSQIAFGDQDDGFDGGFIYSNASRYLAIETANTEKMRITSTGVGIGTTSPNANYKLHVEGIIYGTRLNISSGSNHIDIDGGKMRFYAYSGWKFTSWDSGYVDRVTISSTGDVGLGVVTPSGIEFGGDVSGSYTKGEVKFPQELQNYGAPESEKYGSGLTVDQLQAYLNIPVTENLDVNVSGGVNPYFRDEQGNKNVFGQVGLRYNF
jgi:hypothetical protein